MNQKDQIRMNITEIIYQAKIRSKLFQNINFGISDPRKPQMKSIADGSLQSISSVVYPLWKKVFANT